MQTLEPASNRAHGLWHRVVSSLRGKPRKLALTEIETRLTEQAIGATTRRYLDAYMYLHQHPEILPASENSRSASFAWLLYNHRETLTQDVRNALTSALAPRRRGSHKAHARVDRIVAHAAASLEHRVTHATLAAFAYLAASQQRGDLLCAEAAIAGASLHSASPHAA